jgi:hypothetical protein
MKFFFLSILISLNSIACPLGYDLFTPVEITENAGTGISEEDFNRISSELQNLYSPDVSSRGKKLVVQADWKSTTVNAYARQEGDEWRVIVLGGMARHKHMTRDGYALIVCHEIGHHLGGEPRYDGVDIGWASGEGQSDYFSVMKCLRRYWENSDNAAAVSGMEIPQKLVDECKGEALCIRTGLAGLSAANIFAALAWGTKSPRFETPDTKLTDATILYHPKPQCRLDTYLQGSICEVPFTEEMGTETQGACHETLGHTSGMRPRCWFKPTL